MTTREHRRRFWGPVLVSMAVTPVCLMLVVFFAGGGHGNYLLAKVLLPWAMLSAVITGGAIDFFGLVLAVVQFPLYGWLVGWASVRGTGGRIRLMLFIAHVLAVIVCFPVLSQIGFE